MEEGRAQLRAGEDIPCPPTLQALQKLLLFLSVAPSFHLLPPLPPSPLSFPPSSSYFYTSISDPSQGLPQFVTVGYVDGQPRVSWIEKVGKEDPQYWERETQISHGYEEAFRRNLGTLRIHYNQSEGEYWIWWLLQPHIPLPRNQRGEKGGVPSKGKAASILFKKSFFILDLLLWGRRESQVSSPKRGSWILRRSWRKQVLILLSVSTPEK
uniref:MHC class I-like antigen recognition-like domain-containing protein n=1 Tax=Laticauda laticaudata TaxID=8630 RepID=A0A8C5WTA8_LATLA